MVQGSFNRALSDRSNAKKHVSCRYEVHNFRFNSRICPATEREITKSEGGLTRTGLLSPHTTNFNCVRNIHITKCLVYGDNPKASVF